jgi:regulator of protease activity HflC (stomatin/prohibitin superfamily)
MRLQKQYNRQGSVKLIILTAVCLIGGTTFLSSCTVINSGDVGVVKTMGRIHKEEINPGIHFVKPFVDSVTKNTTRLKSFTVKADAASKDLQKVSSEITVQHSAIGTMAAETNEQIGDLDKVDAVVIGPAINESLKAITAHYTAEQLITMRETVKGQVVDAIRAFIKDTLQQKNIDGALAIHNVAITDFDFSDEFNHSIEEKVKAEQDAHRAENEKTRRTTDAEAAQEVKQQIADGEAYYINKVSQARADAIKRETAALALNGQIVDLRAAEKWDGKLPAYSSGENLPFIAGNKSGSGVAQLPVVSQPPVNVPAQAAPPAEEAPVAPAESNPETPAEN